MANDSDTLFSHGKCLRICAALGCAMASGASVFSGACKRKSRHL